ncbi:MAG TPA: 50S ribosomal protein L15 [Tepidiformaceae bacterium]
MGAHELAPDKGATHAKKRVGRGNSSGHGTYSGKGLKGQKSRSGGKIRQGFEGGQLPLIRRMHVLRGFNNKWKVYYQPVNVSALERFDAGTDVTPETLRSAGIVKHLRQPVKILGDGELSKKLNITANAFTAAAKAKIEAAGGTATLIAASEEAGDN